VIHFLPGVFLQPSVINDVRDIELKSTLYIHYRDVIVKGGIFLVIDIRTKYQNCVPFLRLKLYFVILTLKYTYTSIPGTNQF